MGFFIGWLIVLAFEVLFIYLCVADPSNWLSILIAIVNSVFFIGMTNALIHPKEIKKETSSSSSISTNKNQSASTSNYEKQSASTANYANVVHIKVVGVTVDEAGAFSLNSPRQKRIQQLKSGDKIILKHELDNRYDKSAICVWNAEGKMLGYIPKNSNVSILEELTKNNVKKRLAILLDGNVNKAPVINEPILSGRAQISLGWGDYQSLVKEAEDLSLVLQEGALPASMSEATKTVIGPTRGAESIAAGLKASLLAAILVIAFMIFYYKAGGLYADIAVVLNVLLLLAVLSIFGATPRSQEQR